MRMPYRVVGGTLVAALLAQLAGCGTLFWPERRGQIEGRVDPVIAVLDAIGLLFYIIPGVIAFGVDIATGAIYLPGGTHAQVDPATLRPAVQPDGTVNRARLQAILQQQLGRHLPLDDPRLIEHRGSPEQLAAYGLVPAA
ncbi:polyribonucleotide nucleotidyltransferase [Pseudomonas typographi]|uniref:Polyribonucleotide nucleotidyltransferase n=1 Tax=Pseudomonas typographi TaxID=2715964 RepID=A0ABR7Z691_9PSED|nr:polyribonucleotide nucleotidyltransferase [Pseudomonas typographi]MBD1553501.1 polyribonucleotide nucleotidyltransferase [Pseudomonas typographi]MBD1588962.1 polyribonucleotide nucleotidyltransferase [Pseudomonas typographi]MBD1600975.1 polyribonucleotide nucleotidyltransferase [Pseudomonas typographi]